MSESEKVKMLFAFKVDTKQILERLSKQYQLSMTEIVEKIIPYAEKWNMLNDGWETKVLEAFKEKTLVVLQRKKDLAEHNFKLSQGLADHNFDLAQLGAERDKNFQANMKIFGRVLSLMTKEELNDLWKNKLESGRALMGDRENPSALPEQVKEGGFKIRLNGWEKTVPKLNEKTGLPEIPDFIGTIVKCASGFHVEGSICRGCSTVAVCSTIRSERMGITE